MKPISRRELIEAASPMPPFIEKLREKIRDGSKTNTRRALVTQPTGGVRKSIFASSWWEDGHELRPKYPSGKRYLREHVERGGLLLQRVPANPHNIENPLLRKAVELIETRSEICAADLMQRLRVDWATADQLLFQLVTRNFIDAGRDRKGRHVVLKRETKDIEVYLAGIDTASQEGDKTVYHSI